jgi:hypothetical protein
LGVRTASLLAIGLAGGPVLAQGAEKGVAPDALEVTWTPRAPMSVPRFDLGAAALRGKVYAVGGFSGSTLALVEEYDPANNSWTRKADLPTPRRLLVVAAVNGKVYAIGGASFTDPNALTYSFATDELDPLANTWTTRAPIPMDPPFNSVLGNCFIGGAAVGGKIYVVVFNTNTTGTTATYAYDPATNSWTTGLAPVPFGYTRYAAAASNGKLYVLGISPAFGSGQFAEYDPAANIWVTKSSPPTARQYQTLVAAGDRVYAIGGLGASGPSATVEAFDPATGAWELATPLPTPRHSAGSAATGAMIHAVGGAANSAGLPLAVLESGQSVGEGTSDLCALTLGMSGRTLNLHFDMAAPEAATWNLFVSYGAAVGRIWSVALPAHPGFPLDVPIPNFPMAGRIGFLTTVTRPSEIVCSDWKVVDTGSAVVAPRLDELRDLLKGGLSPRR